MAERNCTQDGGEKQTDEVSQAQNEEENNITGAYACDPDDVLKIVANRSTYEAEQRKQDPLMEAYEREHREGDSPPETNTPRATARALGRRGQSTARPSSGPPPASTDTTDPQQNEFDFDLMKIVAERSREAPPESLDGSSCEQSAARVDDEALYSQNAKKRIAGPLQPGAFGAAPGEQPRRFQSLRYSTFNHEMPEPIRDQESIGTQQRSQIGHISSAGELSTMLGISEGDEELCLGGGHSNENKGLVKAKVVQSTKTPRIDADEIDPQLEEAKHQKRAGLLFGPIAGLCILVSGAVLLILYLSGKFDSTKAKPVTLEASGAPSDAPSLPPTSHFLPLPEYSLEAMEASPDSPQARAYHWLEDDPMVDTYSESRLLQRYAMASFYHATKGDQWTLSIDWLSYEIEECDWYHKFNDQQTVTCDMKGNLLALELTNNGLAGTLPPEIALLTSLELLDVANNYNIRGTIPTEIGIMVSLKELILDSNELSGSIPTMIGYLSKLELLYTHTNPISGTIPTEIGFLTQMKDLELGGPIMTGTLPSELGLLTKMTYLLASESMLEGTIPSQIWNLRRLWEGLILSNNLLNGTISTGIGQLSNTDILNLDRNLFSGAIPSQVGNLQNTTEIRLYSNKLTGSIPSQLLGLSKLAILWLELNALSGTLPQELRGLENVYAILLGNNRFRETIPTQFGHLSHLQVLGLQGNELTGTIPSELGLLARMTGFYTHFNALSGTLPPELFQHRNWDNLQVLEVSYNDLTGTIPTEILYLNSLAEAGIAGTLLSGTVPPNLCNVDSFIMNCSASLCGCECNCSAWGSQ